MTKKHGIMRGFSGGAVLLVMTACSPTVPDSAVGFDRYDGYQERREAVLEGRASPTTIGAPPTVTGAPLSATGPLDAADQVGMPVAVAEVAVVVGVEDRVGPEVDRDAGAVLGVELADFLETKLPPFKRPAHIWHETEHLPRLGTQKIDRKALREQYSKDFAAA